MCIHNTECKLHLGFRAVCWYCEGTKAVLPGHVLVSPCLLETQKWAACVPYRAASTEPSAQKILSVFYSLKEWPSCLYWSVYPSPSTPCILPSPPAQPPHPELFLKSFLYLYLPIWNRNRWQALVSFGSESHIFPSLGWMAVVEGGSQRHLMEFPSKDMM